MRQLARVGVRERDDLDRRDVNWFSRAEVVVGAFLGGWLFAVAFGVVRGGFIVSRLTASVGAVILLWVIRLVAPRRD